MRTNKIQEEPKGNILFSRCTNKEYTENNFVMNRPFVQLPIEYYFAF